MSFNDDDAPITSELLKRAVGTRAQIEDIVVVPVLAVVLALALGGLTMLATGVDVPTIGRAFAALFTGSFGSVSAVSETLTAAAPVTLTALGIALGFRAGLFNIGAEGQMLIGGLAAVVVGFSFPDLPVYIHLPLALIVGALGLIATQLTGYLLRNPPIQKPGRHDPISQSVVDSAILPKLLGWFDPNLRLNAGILIVLAMVVVVYWLLFRTTLGFEFRASGLNPFAARYAGMRSGLIIVAVMAIGGALAGLAGGIQVLGVLGRASPGFSGGAGFNGIAVALLGRSHPVGVLLAGILFGALEAGGRQMQVSAGVRIDLIAIIQALIIVFVAAPLLMRAAFPWAFQKQARKQAAR